MHDGVLGIHGFLSQVGNQQGNVFLYSFLLGIFEQILSFRSKAYAIRRLGQGGYTSQNIRVLSKYQALKAIDTAFFQLARSGIFHIPISHGSHPDKDRSEERREGKSVDLGGGRVAKRKK